MGNYSTVFLKDLAFISSGYSFRGKVEANDEGDFKVVQIKDVKQGGAVRYDELVTTVLPGRPPNIVLEDGDLFFLAKGAENIAVEVCGVQPKTVLSSHFFYLRVDRSLINPSYLEYLINAPEQRKYLEKCSAGSLIKTVNRKSLENMPLKILDLETQEKIASLLNASKAEAEITQRLLENRQQQIHGLINHLTEGK